ncbi:transporter substrate-binding domain-containing protein [Paludibacterium sp.]|nr:transporter substrate-binding domain-containing protein [Paludibacterium sp.]MBV8649474.1 transporter substrate-binding domain-containing protein [Paludibacterium sp.]
MLKWGMRGFCMLAILLGAMQPAHAAEPAVRVLFGLNKPPYIIEGEHRGLEYELISTVFADMGYRIDPVFVPPARMVSLVRAGAFDVATTVRASSGLPGFYSAPYMQYQNMAFVLAKRRIILRSVDDLSDYSVVAFQNAHLVLGDAFRHMTLHNVRYLEVSPQWIENNLLYSGHVDVAVADRRIFQYFNQEVKSHLDTRQPIRMFALFAPTDYQAVFHDGHLRDLFNKSLARIKQDGRYDAVVARYSPAADARD